MATSKYLNYKVIRSWTDGQGNRWFTVAWADGSVTTHQLTEEADTDVAR